MRHHGDIVRIEIAREELTRALTPEMAAEFTRIFKALGFKFVTLDLEGFRSGSMNTLLAAERSDPRALTSHLPSPSDSRKQPSRDLNPRLLGAAEADHSTGLQSNRQESWPDKLTAIHATHSAVGLLPLCEIIVVNLQCTGGF